MPSNETDTGGPKPSTHPPLPNEMIKVISDALQQHFCTVSYHDSDHALPVVIPILYHGTSVPLTFLIYHSKQFGRRMMEPSNAPFLDGSGSTALFIQFQQLESMVSAWATQLGLTYQPVRLVEISERYPQTALRH